MKISRIACCESHNRVYNFDIRYEDVLNLLGWESKDETRNYTKLIYIYKILDLLTYCLGESLYALFSNKNKLLFIIGKKCLLRTLIITLELNTG